MPEISVIIPVYNAEKYLHYCIDSILNQSFDDFEILLINDGSSDNSVNICYNYALKDYRIRVIDKKNGGVSSARNTGIMNAKGIYICFVDSDDFLEENYLSDLIKTKENYFKYGNIWCGFQTVIDYEKHNKKVVIASSNEDFSCYNLNQIMDLHSLWLDASPCNKLYLRKIIVENNITFANDLSLGEDLIFNLHYLDKTNGKIIVINKPLYNYIRDGKESLDNKYYADLLGIYNRINSEIFKYAKKWDVAENQIAKIYSSVFYGYEKVLRNTFDKKNKDSIIKKYSYNNKLMRSKDFTNSLKKMDGKIHYIYRFAYKTKIYFFVRCVDILINTIKR